MTNQQLIEKFYSSFAQGDAEGMISCYADEIQFEDPAFGLLKGTDAKNMWRMLVSPSAKIDISCTHVQAHYNTGSAHWEAIYTFSQTGRIVHNKIDARFEFTNGQITRHTDQFSMWRWASQALGFKGFLLGWSPLLKNKVRRQALAKLQRFSALRNS